MSQVHDTDPALNMPSRKFRQTLIKGSQSEPSESLPQEAWLMEEDKPKGGLTKEQVERYGPGGTLDQEQRLEAIKLGQEIRNYVENEDVVREIQKIYDALTAVQVHLDAKDQMNAALHMNSEIRPTPLASAVNTARANAANLMSRLTDGSQTSASPN